MAQFSESTREADSAGASPTLGSEAPLQSLLNRAIEAHRRDALDEAEALYLEILAREIDNGQALYLLGVVALQRQMYSRAAGLIEQSFAVMPPTPEALINLAIAQQALGRAHDAESALRQAIIVGPSTSRAHNNLGVLLADQGCRDEAHECFVRAHDLDPVDAAALNNLAKSFDDRGQLQRAEELYRECIALRPESAYAHNGLGNVLLKRGDEAGAEAAYRTAILLVPEHAGAWNNLGVVLLGGRQLTEAKRCFQMALQHDPMLVDAWSNLGDVLCLLGRIEEAEAHCRRALALRAHDAEALNNLAAILKKQGRLDDASTALREAIAYHPEYARSYVNLATLQNFHDIDAAEASLRVALEKDPTNAPAKYNMATILLSRGEFLEGFELYESRFRTFTRDFSKARGLYGELNDRRRWQGEALDGKRLLVWSEQGLGDSVMTMRFLPMLAKRGVESLIVACEKELMRMMKTMDGVDDVVDIATRPLPEFDAHCSLMSLPFVLRLNHESLLTESPYLHVPQEVQSAILKSLVRRGGTRIGVAWSGSRALADDSLRSIDIQKLSPLFALDGVQWISLQKGEYDLAGPAICLEVGPIRQCEDLFDTAALVKSLDLVLSVDTVIAHLAGAVNTPVWLLNRYRGDWRWGLRGETSVWYPALRQFRQDERQDWDDVIRAVAIELQRSGALGLKG